MVIERICTCQYRLILVVSLSFGSSSDEMFKLPWPFAYVVGCISLPEIIDELNWKT
jgi:hypothetical protein